MVAGGWKVAVCGWTGALMWLGRGHYAQESPFELILHHTKFCVTIPWTFLPTGTASYKAPSVQSTARWFLVVLWIFCLVNFRMDFLKKYPLQRDLSCGAFCKKSKIDIFHLILHLEILGLLEDLFRWHIWIPDEISFHLIGRTIQSVPIPHLSICPYLIMLRDKATMVIWA